MRNESRVSTYLRLEATGPLTGAEAADALGISRNAVYSWIARNLETVLVVGRGRGGGELYVHVDSPLAGRFPDAPTRGDVKRGFIPSAPATVGSAAPPITSLLGERLLVRSLRAEPDGSKIVELVADNGLELHLTVEGGRVDSPPAGSVTDDGVDVGAPEPHPSSPPLT